MRFSSIAFDRLRAAALILALTVAVLTPRALLACTCVQQTVEQQLFGAAYAFAGLVTDVDQSGNYVVATVQVYRVWKGELSATVRVRTHVHGPTCGFNEPGRRFERGELMLLYAYAPDAPGGDIHTNLCSRSRLLADAAEDLAVLGPGRPPGDVDEADGVELGAAYPNPVDGRTSVPFRLDAEAEVELAVYDLLGRRVGVMASGVFPAGLHQVAFDARGLTAGLYVIVLRTEGRTRARRLLVDR